MLLLIDEPNVACMVTGTKGTKNFDPMVFEISLSSHAKAKKDGVKLSNITQR